MQTSFRRLSALVSMALTFSLILGVTPTAAFAQRVKPFDGAEAVKRGKYWAYKKIPYSQAGYRAGYRRDCSGFVSMAWNLPENLVTWRIPLVAKRIGKHQLQAGDVLLDHTSGSKHVILFERWANKQKTKYVGIEQTGQDGVDRTVRRVLPYPYRVNKSRYKPWRYVGMDRYWRAIPKRERLAVRGYKGPELTPAQVRARRDAAAERRAAERTAALQSERASAEREARARLLKAQEKIEERRTARKRGAEGITLPETGPRSVVGEIVVSLAETVFTPVVGEPQLRTPKAGNGAGAKKPARKPADMSAPTTAR